MPLIASIEHESREYVEQPNDRWYGYFGYFNTEEESRIIVESLRIWKKCYLKILKDRYPNSKFETETWIEKPEWCGYPASIALKLCISGISEDDI